MEMQVFITGDGKLVHADEAYDASSTCAACGGRWIKISKLSKVIRYLVLFARNPVN